MKITLIAFGTSVGGAIIFPILGHNLIQTHLFTIGAWLGHLFDGHGFWSGSCSGGALL